jgi:hypothetical protein
MTAATSGVMYPIGQLKGGELYLKNFIWLDKQRPTNSSDVLLTVPKETRVKIGTSSLMGAGSPDNDTSNEGQNTSKSGQNKPINTSNRASQNTR